MGYSLEMVENNLDLLKLQEQARVNLLLESRKSEGQMYDETDANQADPDFVVFQELLSYDDVDEIDGVDPNLDLLQLASVRRKKKKRGGGGLLSFFLSSLP